MNRNLTLSLAGKVGTKETDGPLKLLQFVTTRVLQSEHFQPREGGGRFLGNDGPLKLLQSFTTRVLQSEDVQRREGGGRFLGNDGK